MKRGREGASACVCVSPRTLSLGWRSSQAPVVLPSTLTSSFIRRSRDEEQVQGSGCASPRHGTGTSFQDEKLWKKEAVRACVRLYAYINFYRHVAVQ